MDVLAIILARSLHSDDALIRTLVDVESNGNLYFVGDLTTLKTDDSLTSADAALRFAEQLQRHGGRPDEYFHGDSGKGLGASHQTGWTALAANVLERVADTRAGRSGRQPSE